MLQLRLCILPAFGAFLAIAAYFFNISSQDMLMSDPSHLFNATAPESLQAFTEQFGLLEYLVDFIKEKSWQLLMFPSTLFFGRIVFSKAKKFAKEGFHDMFSISITTFVKDSDGDDVMAIRTLKEVPIDQIMFDEAATEVMKTAATTNAPKDDAFHFVNLEGLPDARRNVGRLRSHCASEVSALFGVFQALAAMRVGPIVCRKFCWAVTYDMEQEDDNDHRTFSLKSVAMSIKAISRLSQKDGSPDLSRRGSNDQQQQQQQQQPTTAKKEPVKKDESSVQHNKFRMILVELGCLRQAHLKAASDLDYEVNNAHYRQRWDTIRAMQNLFCLRTGMPPPTSTILCGTVTFSAPLQEEMPAPWESWAQSSRSSSIYEKQFIQALNTKLASKRSLDT